MSHKNELFALQKGALLLSEPFAEDKVFGRAAVLIVDHSDTDGTVGFLLNKPIQMPVSSVVKGMKNFEGEMFLGGPVQTDTLHYIHTKGDLIKDSILVKDNIYWSGDFEQIRFCVNNELITEQDIRFFVGYAGWEVGQLREEIDAGHWWVVENDPNYAFQIAAEALWSRALAEQGAPYNVIAQMPFPNLN